MKNKDTNSLIESVDLSPKVDMKASDMENIKNRNLEKLGRLDICDLMYDAYKLGFARAMEKGAKV